MSKLLNKLNGLFTKVDETEASYMKALEQKEAELLEINLELQDKQKMLTDLHKMKLLNQVSEEAFNAEKVKVDALKSKVVALQEEISLIDRYKTEDIHSVLGELEAEKGKYSKEQQAEIRRIQMELLNAKNAYLNKMVEARERYKKIAEPAFKLEQLKIKLGLQVRSYTSGSHDTLSMVSVGEGHENLLVEHQTVYDALSYGRTPERLQRVVSDAREKGII
ncbi:hypothetical protein [Metabacillus sediminilitoris]|uniref:Uncharacterized protein n=1 Tax=Metabacillus sediminilitoris TaxID=2567941 RepID=A0A4S4BZA0_9BACI|nr:hypothetical protein [Metabacillus sediminilitoris]QGQ47248.1 hypothetical protein GMB29_19535 [Metabacillus sediminilitoris]THF80590.1 hypothetical protein E6W99_09330 [Metabacillus sediminilitoris]